MARTTFLASIVPREVVMVQYPDEDGASDMERTGVFV